MSHSTYRKNIGQIHFLTEKIAFFQKICVLNNLLSSQKNDPITCTIIAKIPCGTKEYSMSIRVGNRRENGQNLFFLRDDSLIFEKFGSRLLRSYKKRSHRLHHTCQKTLWTLIYCSLTFFVFDNARNNWRSFINPCKDCFFQKFVLSSTSYVLKKILFLPQ